MNVGGWYANTLMHHSVHNDVIMMSQLMHNILIGYHTVYCEIFELQNLLGWVPFANKFSRMAI